VDASDSAPPPDKTPIKPDTVPDKNAWVCGTLVNPSGTLLASFTVLMCEDTVGCANASTTPAGAFCLPAKQKGHYLFRAMNGAWGGKHYADIYFMVTVSQADVDGEKNVDVGKVIVPPMAKALQTVDMKNGGAYDLGGGVSLTIGAGISKKPPLEQKLEVGAAALKAGQVHALSGANYKGTGKLHMAVAFYPLETTFTAPVPFKFPSLGLTASAAVEVYFLSDLKGKLTKQADGLEKGGSIVNVKGQGLKNLGIFLVYTK